MSYWKGEQLSVSSSLTLSHGHCMKAWIISGHLTAGFHYQRVFIKMAHHFALAVFILAFTGFWSMCAADVGDFAPCLESFYRAWPPKGLVGTPICQRYQNQYRFATLYSRPRRTPWFSAYLYATPEGKRPHTFWKYEPQVSLKLCQSWYHKKVIMIL